LVLYIIYTNLTNK